VQAAKFAEICKTVCVDPTVDLATVQGLLPVNPGDACDPEPLRGLMASTDKPILAFGRIAQNVSDISRKFQSDTGVPFIHGLPETVRALQNLVRYADAVRRSGTALEPPDARAPTPDANTFEALLAAHGLTPPRGALAKTPEAAAAKAKEIGFPVAVKIVSPQANHKTEIGGVALHLGDAAAVRSAAEGMASKLLAHDARAELEGFLVQEMVDGLEMILGARADAQYGPILVVGLGGVTAEVIKDVAIRLLPVDEDTAFEMIRSLRGAALLDRFRGRAPRDMKSLVRAMTGLSRLFLAQRESFEDIEINPLVVLAEGDGVRAVDVRIVKRRPQGS
jgi:acetate---CoA ligase (ADP-forming)